MRHCTVCGKKIWSDAGDRWYQIEFVLMKADDSSMATGRGCETAKICPKCYVRYMKSICQLKRRIGAGRRIMREVDE